MTTRLLTAAQVAEALSVGRSTVYSLTHRGELRSVVVSQGSERALRRWRQQDVDEFIERQLDEENE